jgi:hypothetical protein
MFEVRNREDLRTLLEGDGNPKFAGSDRERVFFSFDNQEFEFSWELKAFLYELSICWPHHANGGTINRSISFPYPKRYQLVFGGSPNPDEILDLVQEVSNFLKVQEILEKFSRNEIVRLFWGSDRRYHFCPSFR